MLVMEMAVVMNPVLKVHLQTLLPLLLKEEVQWAGKEMHNHQVEKMMELLNSSPQLSPGGSVKVQLEREDV